MNPPVNDDSMSCYASTLMQQFFILFTCLFIVVIDPSNMHSPDGNSNNSNPRVSINLGKCKVLAIVILLILNLLFLYSYIYIMKIFEKTFF